MASELKKLFDLATENAARIFKESGEVLPMWHAITGNDENMVIATPWSDDKEKDAAVAGLKSLFKIARVKRFAFIVEAWARTVDPEEVGKPIEGRVSQHPDRREVLMVRAEDRDGTAMSGFYFILRPEHGKPTLSPLKIEDYGTHTAGRMIGMLT